MNHDDEHELFDRLEQDIAGEVVDLGKARQRRRPGEADPPDWQVDLDDETETDEPTPVDPPNEPHRSAYVASLAGQVPTRRPIVPGWLRSRSELKAVTRWAFGHYTHVAAYHATRTPKYAGRLVWRAPRGVVRTMTGTKHWMTDAEAVPVRLAAVRREDGEEYRKLANLRDGRVRLRTWVVVLTLLTATVAAFVVLVSTPEVKWTALALLVAVLGVVGSPKDRPLLDVAAIAPRVRRLSADVVLRAFLAARLCKEDDPITFPAPITRDGPGWRAVIDLPYWTTADKAIKKRDDIAAGLDLDEVQVWPERVRGAAGSARRLSLWVADEDPYAKASGPWPLIERGTVDVFAPFPFGQDQRGRAVALQLMFTSLLVGAIPRMGKTYAGRLPVLAAGLDPIVELHIYNGKGPVDWGAFERIAHRIGFGVRDDVVAALVMTCAGWWRT